MSAALRRRYGRAAKKHQRVRSTGLFEHGGAMYKLHRASDGKWGYKIESGGGTSPARYDTSTEAHEAAKKAIDAESKR